MYNNNFGQTHVILVPAIGTYLPQKYERKFFRSRPNPYSRIPVKEECSVVLSESLTTEAAFFPAKAELSLLLRESLDKVSAMTLSGPST
jgi:hypothetical protein